MKVSDQMFLELDKKRIKLKKQTREERQFLLQMMQMLLGSFHQPCAHSDPHSQFFPGFLPMVICSLIYIGLQHCIQKSFREVPKSEIQQET